MENNNKAFDILKGYKEIVWQEIKDYLERPVYPQSFKIPNEYSKDINSYWKIVRDYPERQGKYLRPSLTIMAAEAMGLDSKTTVKTAGAMQLSEDWILIYDDFQDRSLFRRGKPTLHKLYGPELAINAGISLQILIWDMLSDNDSLLGEKKSFLILKEFSKMLERTSDGQAIEKAWSLQGKTNYTENDWYFIADGKTAYYTIAGPLRLGAIMANASKKQLELLSVFGIHLGRCFNLVDDLLDLTSDYRGSGQKAGGDIVESKVTIPLIHLLKNSKSTDRENLLRIVKKDPDEKSGSEVLWVIEKMKEYKSLDYAQKLAKEYKNRALSMFEKDLGFLSRPEAREKLRTVIHFVLNREY